ncbi:MAG: hypothetical protein ACM34K_06740, partial [Bacillota bacterium]
DRGIIDAVSRRYENSIFISAERGINIGRLKDMISSCISESFKEETVELDINDSEIVSRIYSLAEVINTVYDEDKILVKYRANNASSNKIKRMIYGQAQTGT